MGTRAAKRKDTLFRKKTAKGSLAYCWHDGGPRIDYYDRIDGSDQELDPPNYFWRRKNCGVSWTAEPARRSRRKFRSSISDYPILFSPHDPQHYRQFPEHSDGSGQESTGEQQTHVSSPYLGQLRRYGFHLKQR
jgi:hypothetical protein